MDREKLKASVRMTLTAYVRAPARALLGPFSLGCLARS